jgi:hypothetical protein
VSEALNLAEREGFKGDQNLIYVLKTINIFVKMVS